MPKLRQTEREKKNLAMQALIEKNMVLSGYANKKELAKRLAMSPRTVYYKFRSPDTFTRGELRALFNVLNFTDEEKLQVI